MADIPVNRVANNLVITQKDNSKYLGLYIPIVTPTQLGAIPATLTPEGAPILAVQTNPTTGYYATLNLNTLFQTQAHVYEQIVTCSTAASGAGLISGTSFILPKGARVNVEVAGNQVDGFEYYDITNHVLRNFYNGAWHTTAVI